MATQTHLVLTARTHCWSTSLINTSNASTSNHPTISGQVLEPVSTKGERLLRQYSKDASGRSVRNRARYNAAQGGQIKIHIVISLGRCSSWLPQRGRVTAWNTVLRQQTKVTTTRQRPSSVQPDHGSCRILLIAVSTHDPSQQGLRSCRMVSP